MSKNKLDLMKCAVNRHSYGDPTRDKALQRLVKVCKHCGDKVILSSESLSKIQKRKNEIIEDLNNDSYMHAKMRLDSLLKEFGY